MLNVYNATHGKVAPIEFHDEYCTPKQSAWWFLHRILRPLSADGPMICPGYLSVFTWVAVVT